MKTRASTSILVEGIRNAAFTARVRAKIARALGCVDPPPTMAKVIFADENGPKGGVGIRCTVVSDMPRRRELSVTGLGETGEIAFDAAFAALDERVRRDRARRRALVRRPKKYFLAKRLLASDAALNAPGARAESAGPRPKRARRRRVA